MKSTRRSLLLMAGMATSSLVFAQAGSQPSTQAAQAASGGLPGKWHFLFDTEGGPRTFDADFKLDGQNVTGTWNNKPGVKGTFADGKLDLEFPMTSDEVGDGTLKLNGKLSDDLSGSWSFQSYNGTFKATRVKD